MVNEIELNQFLDGELPDSRSDGFLREVADSPDLAMRLKAYRENDDRLRAHLAGALSEPVPTHLLAAVRRAHRPLWRQMALAASLVVAIGAGMVLGWSLHDGAPASGFLGKAPMPRFVHQAAVAHAVYTPEVKHPVEVGADQEAHLVAWLSKRIGTPLKVPNLKAEGYELVGGRLLSTEAGPAALFMFQDAGGQRLTLFLSKGSDPDTGASFRYLNEGSTGVFYWVDDGFGCALSGSIGRDELLRLTNVVYKQIDH